MIEAASRYGYADATVARVIEFAGVSRATFYEHFAGREECFRAAYRAISRDLVAAVETAAGSTAPGERLSVVLDVLVARLASDPRAARLVLIEAFAAPPGVRGEHEALMAAAELLVARSLDEQLPVAAIQIPATVLLAGIGEVLASRVLNGDVTDLRRVRADLSTWIDAYRLPSGALPLPQRRWGELGRFAKTVAPRVTSAPPLLPRGRTSLPPADAASARRRRLLDATARLVTTDGYSALTVARIAADARVPRAAFYSHFECKQEALLEAQTVALQEGMSAAAAAYSPVAPWPQRIWRAGEALLSEVGANRDYAHLDFVESYAAGPLAVHRRHQNHMAFAIFLEEGYRQVPETVTLPRLCMEAIAGGVFGLMRGLVVEGKAERMLSLLPAAAYAIFAPFTGAGAASARVQEWARAAP